MIGGARYRRGKGGNSRAPARDAVCAETSSAPTSWIASSTRMIRARSSGVDGRRDPFRMRASCGLTGPKGERRMLIPKQSRNGFEMTPICQQRRVLPPVVEPAALDQTQGRVEHGCRRIERFGRRSRIGARNVEAASAGRHPLRNSAARGDGLAPQRRLLLLLTGCEEAVQIEHQPAQQARPPLRVPLGITRVVVGS